MLTPASSIRSPSARPLTVFASVPPPLPETISVLTVARPMPMPIDVERVPPRAAVPSDNTTLPTPVRLPASASVPCTVSVWPPASELLPSITQFAAGSTVVSAKPRKLTPSPVNVPVLVPDARCRVVLPPALASTRPVNTAPGSATTSAPGFLKWMSYQAAPSVLSIVTQLITVPMQLPVPNRIPVPPATVPKLVIGPAIPP